MKTTTSSGFMLIVGLVSFALVTSLVLFLIPKTEAEIYIPKDQTQVTAVREGKAVLVFLDTMTLELHNGTTTVSVIPIISKGKPGSYYETPGGEYAHDYKIPLHFSSIGHVYMPNSIHVFGNFFIHGIPYYPNGEKVSSSYSGGCIRLSDTDSKEVYDFIEKGTPIIITKKNLPYASLEINPRDMTSLMVATISLEFQTQDNPITFNNVATTRRELLPLILQGDAQASLFITQSLGRDTFVSLMNTKAKAIGLENTTFRDVTSEASTTALDSVIFYNYLTNYKSYLLATSTFNN